MYRKDDKKQSTNILFQIQHEVKHFYETPAIFFTRKNYTDLLYDAMVAIRRALLNEAPRKDIRDIIVDIHLQWLSAVNEIKEYKSTIDMDNLDREYVYVVIEYTMEEIDKRLMYHRRYIEKYRPSYTIETNAQMQIELEVLEVMHKVVFDALGEQLKCFRNHASAYEFYMKLMTAVSELEDYMDKIHDSFILMLNYIMNGNEPDFIIDCSRFLQQLIEDLYYGSSATSKQFLEDIKKQDKTISDMTRYVRSQRLEIDVIRDKLERLEDLIAAANIGDDKSIVLKTLKIKKNYLLQRLDELDRKTMTAQTFAQLHGIPLVDAELCTCADFYKLRMFNHFIPLDNKHGLVTKLCSLWDSFFFGDKHKSVISILSASDVKEGSDEFGQYFIDHYGRKIYKKPDDDTFYQLNEHNVLVPVSDDDQNIYYYDDCGRYYLDATSKQRIYKANSTASDYVMEAPGEIIKIKEVRDGVTFFFDQFGRYYLDDDGTHIYKEPDTISEYEHDGFGNLVRRRTDLVTFEPCPDDANVTEDCKYLKNTVGSALRKCVAELIKLQPIDPIKYLAGSLIKHKADLVERERMAKQQEELEVEREIKANEEREAAEKRRRELAMLEHVGSEASYDSNLISYKSGGVTEVLEAVTAATE